MLTRLTYQMNIRNPYLKNIKIKYPLAFEAGVIAAKVVESKTGFQIGEHEIGFLALHIGAALERLPNHFKYENKKSRRRTGIEIRRQYNCKRGFDHFARSRIAGRSECVNGTRQ